MKTNRIEAQRLSIRLLCHMSTFQVLAVTATMEARREYTEIRDQFLLCQSVASELRSDPKKYDTFDMVCRSILARQQNRSNSEILKKDYQTAMGIRSTKIWRRIETGERDVKLVEIEKLCSGFSQEADRRFWANQIMLLIPDIRNMPEECVEGRCLFAIWASMAPKQRERARTELDLSQWQLDVLDEKDEGIEGVQSLYDTLGNAIKLSSWNLDELLEDALGIDRKTWYSWSRAWKEAERKKFADGIPRNRLSRIQLLLLAVLLDMGYWKTVNLLALAGTCFRDGAVDRAVLDYQLLGKGTPGELGRLIRDSMYVI